MLVRNRMRALLHLCAPHFRWLAGRLALHPRSPLQPHQLGAFLLQLPQHPLPCSAVAAGGRQLMGHSGKGPAAG